MTLPTKSIFALIFMLAAPNMGQAANCVLPGNLANMKQEAEILVNRQRTARGLQAVSTNAKLESVAQSYACDMAVHGYFSHKGRNNSNVMKRVQKAGYSGCQFAENIALGLPDSKSTIDGWMGSSGHKKNILLRKIDEMGMGIAVQDGRMLWVQVLACKR